MRNTRLLVLGALAVAVFGLTAVPNASAAPIPAGWTCIGNCGSLGPDGIVTAPPNGPTYNYVSTNGAGAFGGLNLGFNETNGSQLTTNVLALNVGDILSFYFNYVTSDGAGFPEYGYATLKDTNAPFNSTVLFTARTASGLNTVPGPGMPALAPGVSLVPPSTPIITGPGTTTWSPLGGSSGACFLGFGQGCGYTNWIGMNYVVPVAGSYVLNFGVVNVNDTAFDTGMAISGNIQINNPIPEPTTMLLLGSGLILAAGRLRSRRAQ